MKLTKYKKHIMVLAEKHNTDMSTAADMFLNNIEDTDTVGDQYKYPGLEGFDYAKLHPHLKELRESKQEFVDKYCRG